MTERGVGRAILWIVEMVLLIYFVFQHLGWTWKLVGIYLLITFLYVTIDGCLRRIEA